MKKALNLFEKRIVMSATNPIITTPEEQFVVGESDFAFFGNYASRCEGGAILYCRKGSADATVNQYCGQVRRNTLILVLPGSLLMLTNRTEDFRMTFCAFSRDLFAEAQATADNVRGGARRFSAAKAVDGRADTYWATDDGVTAATLSLRFEQPRRVNRILLQEYIPLGQRVGRFAVEWLDGDTWRPVETAEEMTTIGYKRIIRFAGVTTPALRVRFGQARGPLCISNVEAYDAPVLLEEPRIVRNGAGEVTLAAGDTQAEIRYTLDGTEPGPSSELYAKPFPMTGRGVVKALVRDPEDRRTSAVASRGFDIPCGAFRVKELPDEEAVGLFDGDVSTVVYLPAGVAGFSADTGEERTFRGFAYTPDQSRWASGVVTRYRVSVDGRTAAEGEFSNIVNNPVEQVVEFEPLRGRTVRFEALSLAAGDRPGIAEFSVLTE